MEIGNVADCEPSNTRLFLALVERLSGNVADCEDFTKLPSFIKFEWIAAK